MSSAAFISTDLRLATSIGHAQASGSISGGDNDLREATIREFRNLVERTNLAGVGRSRCPSCRQRIAALWRRIPRRTHRKGRYTCGAVCTSRLKNRLAGHWRSTCSPDCTPGPTRIPVSFTHPEVVHLRRPTQPRPKWYLHALENHPKTVADAFVAVTRARVRRKEAPDQHLYDLPWEPEYGGVGPLAVPKMLAPFPIRCTKAQVVSLRLLLWTALKYMPPEDLRQLGRVNTNEHGHATLFGWNSPKLNTNASRHTSRSSAAM